MKERCRNEVVFPVFARIWTFLLQYKLLIACIGVLCITSLGITVYLMIGNDEVAVDDHELAQNDLVEENEGMDETRDVLDKPTDEQIEENSSTTENEVDSSDPHSTKEKQSESIGSGNSNHNNKNETDNIVQKDKSNDDPLNLDPTLVDVQLSTESVVIEGIGQQVSIKVLQHWSDGQIHDVTDDTVWYSEDATIVTTANGIITAIFAGTTTVWAEWGGKNYPIDVTVIELFYSFSIEATETQLTAGEEVQITLSIYRSDGSIDKHVNGDYPVIVRGYDAAPFFGAGKLNGVELRLDEPTEVIMSFENGVAHSVLQLRKADSQTLIVTLEDLGEQSFSLRVNPGEVNELELTSDSFTEINELEPFAFRFSLLDAFGNEMSLASLDMTINVLESKKGVASVTWDEANVLWHPSYVELHNASMKGIDTDVRLQVILGDVEYVSEPFQIIGFFESGAGTEEHPYTISSWEELNYIRERLDSHFEMTTNVNLPESLGDYDDPGGWVPIGTRNEPFTGAFNGGGHTIKNLIIERGEDFQGLFGYSEGADIRNLTIENAIIKTTTDDEVTGKSNIGILAGRFSSLGTVSNVSVTGEVIGNLNVGGAIGFFSGTMTNVQADVTVTAYNGNVGGLIGDNFGNVIYSQASGEVTRGSGCTASYCRNPVGGLIGLNQNIGKVKFSFATSNVISMIANQYTGGLIGENYGIVDQSYATGDVQARSDAGGLIGVNRGAISNVYSTGNVSGEHHLGGLISYNEGSVLNAYATGLVTDLYDSSSSFVSFSLEGTITNGYFFQESPGSDYGWQISSEAMRRRSSFRLFSFVGDNDLEDDPIWIINDGHQMPQLYWTFKYPTFEHDQNPETVTVSNEFVELDLSESTSQQISLTGTWEDGTTMDITEKAMWHSSDSSIATVNNGEIEAINAGEVVIKAILKGKIISILVIVE